MEGTLEQDHVLVERTDRAVTLCNQSCYGTVLKRSIKLPLYDAAYLQETGKLTVLKRGKQLAHNDLMRAGRRNERAFPTKYAVYRDLRKRGYIVKTALKFGADFRVYDKGVKPGQDHAKWIAYPVRESDRMTWYDFSAKNRVAHSTRKRLLLAVVDQEGDVTYFQVSWERP